MFYHSFLIFFFSSFSFPFFKWQFSEMQWLARHCLAICKCRYGVFMQKVSLIKTFFLQNMQCIFCWNNIRCKYGYKKSTRYIRICLVYVFMYMCKYIFMFMLCMYAMFVYEVCLKLINRYYEDNLMLQNLQNQINQEHWARPQQRQSFCSKIVCVLKENPRSVRWKSAGYIQRWKSYRLKSRINISRYFFYKEIHLWV